MIKKCSTCKQFKDISFFNKNKSTKTGYAHECRLCCLERAKIYTTENKKKISDNNKIKYQKNIDVMRLRKRQYAAKNRDAEKKRASLWYQQNKKRKQEYDR